MARTSKSGCGTAPPLNPHLTFIISSPPPLHISPPGRSVLMSGGKDNEVRVWDCPSGRCVAQGVGHVAAVGAVALSRKAARKFAISAGADKLLKVSCVCVCVCGSVIAGGRGAGDWHGGSVTQGGAQFSISAGADRLFKARQVCLFGCQWWGDYGRGEGCSIHSNLAIYPVCQNVAGCHRPSSLGCGIALQALCQA